MELIYQEHFDLDGELLAVPVIPASATADEIEGIVAEEGAAVMTDEQAAELSAHLAEGVTCAGFARRLGFSEGYEPGRRSLMTAE